MSADVSGHELVRGRQRSRWPRWALGQNVVTLLGVITATWAVAALGLYGWLFMRSMQRAGWTLTHLTDLLYLWQTQTGVAFAVAAAILGATAVLYQTAATRRGEEERRARRFVALRAVLPLTLSELTDYAAACAKIHETLLSPTFGIPIVAPGIQCPSLPNGLVDRLAEIIEASDERHTRPLVVLIQHVQIQHARVQRTKVAASGASRSLLFRPNVIAGIVDAAELHARCGNLFIYAREDADSPAAPIHADHVKAALYQVVPSLADTKEVEDELKGRAMNGDESHPWPKN